MKIKSISLAGVMTKFHFVPGADWPIDSDTIAQKKLGCASYRLSQYCAVVRIMAKRLLKQMTRKCRQTTVTTMIATDNDSGSLKFSAAIPLSEASGIAWMLQNERPNVNYIHSMNADILTITLTIARMNNSNRAVVAKHLWTTLITKFTQTFVDADIRTIDINKELKDRSTAAKSGGSFINASIIVKSDVPEVSRADISATNTYVYKCGGCGYVFGNKTTGKIKGTCERCWDAFIDCGISRHPTKQVDASNATQPASIEDDDSSDTASDSSDETWSDDDLSDSSQSSDSEEKEPPAKKPKYNINYNDDNAEAVICDD